MRAHGTEEKIKTLKVDRKGSHSRLTTSWLRLSSYCLQTCFLIDRAGICMERKSETLPKVPPVASPVWIMAPFENLLKAVGALPRNMPVHSECGLSFCGVHGTSSTQVRHLCPGPGSLWEETVSVCV